MWSVILFLVALLSDSRAAIASVAGIGLAIAMTFGMSSRYKMAAFLGRPDPDPASIFVNVVFSIIVFVLVARAIRLAYFKFRRLPAPRFL
jgi:hypothetical protein